MTSITQLPIVLTLFFLSYVVFSYIHKTLDPLPLEAVMSFMHDPSDVCLFHIEPRKKAAKTTFIQNIRTFNVDEIDTREKN